MASPYHYSNNGPTPPVANTGLVEYQHHQKNILCPFVTTGAARESADYQQNQQKRSSSSSILYPAPPSPQFPSPQLPGSSSPQQPQQSQQELYHHRQSFPQLNYGEQFNQSSSSYSYGYLPQRNTTTNSIDLTNATSHFVPVASPSAIFSHPPSQNQLEYLQWLQQVQREQHSRDSGGPVERPLSIWCIGTVDILSAMWYTGLVVHNILTKPISDPDAYIWRFFVGFLSILVRLLMGVGLVIGLRSKDDSSTLWYCKLWVACQLVFFAHSGLEVISTVLLYASNSSKSQELPPAILSIVAVLVYRIICFVLVRLFIGKLRKSECMSVGDAIAYAEQQQLEQDEQDNRFGTGESSFCGPSVALIMSL